MATADEWLQRLNTQGGRSPRAFLSPSELSALSPKAAPKKPGNFWTNTALPVAGGIIGGTAGTVLGPLGAIGGSAGGSALGAALGNLLEGNQNKLEGVGREALYGGLGEAGGQIIGRVGGRLIGRASEKAAERLASSALKESPRAARAALKTGSESLGRETLKRGIAGGEEKLFQQSLESINQLEDGLQALLAGSKRVMPTSELREAVQPLLSRYSKAGNESAVSAITKRLEAIQSAHPKGMPLSVANEVKRTLYDEARNAYGRLAGEETEGIKALAKGLKKGIAKRASGVDAINKELSFHGRLADATFDRLIKNGSANVLSLTDMAVGGAGAAAFGPAGLAAAGARRALGSTAGKTYLAKGISAGGRMAGRLGEALAGTSGVTGRVLGRAATQGLPRLGQAAAAAPTGAIEDVENADVALDSEYGPDASLTSTESLSPQSNLSDQLASMAWEAYRNGDVKGLEAVGKLKAVLGVEDSKGGGLNSTAAGIVSDLQNGIANIRQLGEQYKSSGANVPFGIGALRGKNPLDTEAQDLKANTARIKQVIGKALEGGVLRKEDEAKYQAILPTLNDTDAVAQRKIKAIANDLQRKLMLYQQSLGVGGGGNDLAATLAGVY